MEFWYKGQRTNDITLLSKQSHVIVSGIAGIGKSVFCKAMSNINQETVYCEVQDIESVEENFRKNALACIELKQVI